MGFLETLQAEPLARHLERAQHARPADVEAALAGPIHFEQFLTLLSPAAAAYLEPMARRAHALTRERFGKVVQLYAPIYVSNECTNRCIYCGFAVGHDIHRVTLDDDAVEREGQALHAMGFRHVLLVSGEAPKAMPLDRLERIVARLHPMFPSLSVEVYPESRQGYERLGAVGIDGVTVYQETYDPALYASVHPGGKKADFAWRLETPTRAGEAGMRRVGIGALLGLGPWRREAIALALHAQWLQKMFWRTQVSISFPRIREAAGGFRPPEPVSDAELVQLACALRLLLPDAGLALSTRETARFRDGLVPLCITMMSAGSRTEPGGYNAPGDAGEQFAVEDRRTPDEVGRMLLSRGLEPVWKDADQALTDAPLPGLGGEATLQGSAAP